MTEKTEADIPLAFPDDSVLGCRLSNGIHAEQDFTDFVKAGDMLKGWKSIFERQLSL